MKKNKLAILITFCNKDVQYIPELLMQIKNKVKVPYQLILSDNRLDKTEKLSFNIDQSFSDVGCLIPRKEAIKLIDTEYVWFIDADDDITNDIVLSDFESNADIITFKCIDSDNKPSGTWPLRGDDLYGKYIKPKFYKYYFQIIGPTLWNKFIKYDLYIHILEIPNTNTVCNEDSYINTYLLKFTTSVYFLDKVIYKYNFNRGDVRSKVIDLNKFKRLCRDAYKIYDSVNILFSEKEQKRLLRWISPEDSCAILLQLLSRSNDNDYSSELELLENEFPKYIIRNTLKRWITR